MNKKPLGYKSYGSIPHLPYSRLGSGDHCCHEGQALIATQNKRDKHDIVIVQEKLDGGNVGVCKLNGEIIAITRAGYLAHTSPYEQHWHFDKWVAANKHRFTDLLKEGERVCGEWLMQACATKYKLPHEPFVAFDLMTGTKRATYEEIIFRTGKVAITTPHTINIGEPMSVEAAMDKLQVSGHGAIDEVEGAIWRVERKGKVDFIVKFVKHNKIDGIYLPEISGQPAIWNVSPIELFK